MLCSPGRLPGVPGVGFPGKPSWVQPDKASAAADMTAADLKWLSIGFDRPLGALLADVGARHGPIATSQQVV